MNVGELIAQLQWECENGGPTLAAALQTLLAAERERCAKVCDGLESTGGLWDAAGAIRRMK